jgi:C-terminal processing protease CtpA/Prc
LWKSSENGAGNSLAGSFGVKGTYPGGYRVAWTGMKVLKHDGSQHHGIGISPTIPVARTRAAVAAGRDEFLEAAKESVRH